MTTPTPKVFNYGGWGGAAVVGPFNAYEVGDEFDLPGRGPKHGDKGVAPFTAVVVRVAEDGLAICADKAAIERAAA